MRERGQSNKNFTRIVFICRLSTFQIKFFYDYRETKKETAEKRQQIKNLCSWNSNDGLINSFVDRSSSDKLRGANEIENEKKITAGSTRSQQMTTTIILILWLLSQRVDYASWEEKKMDFVFSALLFVFTL